MGPAHAALDGVAARHQESLLLPLQVGAARGLRGPARLDRRHPRTNAGCAIAHRLRGVPGMSVIDLARVDPRTLIGAGRIGLLDSTGTYDIDRYSWAYEFWKRQQQTHWMGEEV